MVESDTKNYILTPRLTSQCFHKKKMVLVYKWAITRRRCPHIFIKVPRGMWAYNVLKLIQRKHTVDLLNWQRILFLHCLNPKIDSLVTVSGVQEIKNQCISIWMYAVFSTKFFLKICENLQPPPFEFLDPRLQSYNYLKF